MFQITRRVSLFCACAADEFMTDDDPDLERILELFATEEIALFDARAQVAWHERAIADLAKAHPEAVALRPPISEFAVADLRTGELKDALGRIKRRSN